MIANALAPAIDSRSYRAILDPREIFPLFEWFSGNDTSHLFTNTNGTGAVSADNTALGSVVGLVNGTRLSAASNGGGDPYRTARIGTRGAIAFSGSNKSFTNAAVNKTFSNGLTVVFTCRRTGNTAFRSILDMGPAATNGNTSPNGYGIDTGTGGTNIRVGSNNNITADFAVANTTNYLIVARWNNAIGATNIAGIETSATPGFIDVRLNGGLVDSFSWSGSNAAMATVAMTLGGRNDSAFGCADDIGDMFIVDGYATPKQLQLFVDRWLIPTYGSGVF